jgi:outer membrane protein OmpA-like peptidoglycan-associated protein
MKVSQSDSFWPSYTDLMTSLFFIMLVLFVLVYSKQHKQIVDLERKLAIVNAVDQNLKPLKSDKTLFIYEEQYKRFKMSFDVKFKNGKYIINEDELELFYQTENKIKQAGMKLKTLINELKENKESNSKLKDVSYVLVIAGYASKTGVEKDNYELSYKRALGLRDYWRSNGIDFESVEFKDLVDLQIAGNGWGGLGRSEIEVENQRFIIQIFPKIGDIK